MRLLVLVSRPDPASVNIRDALVDMETWKETGSFEGFPLRVLDRTRGEGAAEGHVGKQDGFVMVETAKLHLECDRIDERLRAAGLEFDAILVASKHKAESGRSALTVHPIGNFDAAEYGGLPRRLVPTAPRVMARVLRRLRAEASGSKHAATYEATHHGPYLETPTAFVEIGTDATSWSDPDLGRRVARA